MLKDKNKSINADPFLFVLGIAQDGGVPHAGCGKSCCKNAWRNLSQRRFPTSLAIVDLKTKQRWIIDATPDFKFQLKRLDRLFPVKTKSIGLEGIFLTHGHVGHYTGLLQLEKAVLDTKHITVFAMPKLRNFILNNQPWKSLVGSKNILLKTLTDKKEVKLNRRISVKPFLVLHRAEYSETVGFLIKGPNKSILFIPDIDRWEGMEEEIENKIQNADMAFLDGTFFDKNELPHRDIKEIPHPTIKTSIDRFNQLSPTERNKIFFIHLNHTNPALRNRSFERRTIHGDGFNVAKEQSIFFL